MSGEGHGSLGKLAVFLLVAAACAGACGKSVRSDEERVRGRGGTGGSGNKPNGAGAPSGGASGAAGLSNGGSPANGGVGGDAAGAAGVAGESGGEGGEPPEACDDGAVRCLAAVGLRERCSAGEWAREEFACATSVRVENLNGIPCAAKADGRFHCWGVNGFSMFSSTPALPGTVRAVLGGGSVPRTWDGTLFLLEDGALFSHDGLSRRVATDVASFERDYFTHDLCVVARDGGAHCSVADLSALAPSGTAGFRQVFVAGNDACALDMLGRIRCKFSVLSGEYAELAIGNFPCARTLEGAIECATPWAGELGFDVPTGSFTRIAMADETVCGIRDTGAIACAGLEGQSPEPPEGTFTDIDGGDRVFCAIHIDGSVRCFSTHDGSDLGAPEGW
jgi:hypothetical protein